MRCLFSEMRKLKRKLSLDECACNAWGGCVGRFFLFSLASGSRRADGRPIRRRRMASDLVCFGRSARGGSRVPVNCPCRAALERHGGFLIRRRRRAQPAATWMSWRRPRRPAPASSTSSGIVPSVPGVCHAVVCVTVSCVQRRPRDSPLSL